MNLRVVSRGIVVCSNLLLGCLVSSFWLLLDAMGREGVSGLVEN